MCVCRRSRSGTIRSKQSLLDVMARSDNSNLLDQIFQFIGSKPEKAVSFWLFFSSFCSLVVSFGISPTRWCAPVS